MNSRLRSLASDTVVYGLSTIVGRMMSFLLNPLYTNYISKAENGEVAAVYSYIAFLNILLSLGLESAFFRFYDLKNEENSKRVFSIAFYLIFIAAFIVISVVFLFSEQVSLFLKISSGKEIIRFACAIAFFDALSLIPYALLRMMRRSRDFALHKFSMIVCNFLANLVFVVWLGIGINGIFIAGVVSSFYGLLVVVPLIREQSTFHFPISEFNFQEKIKEILTFSLPTVPAAFAAIMLQVADRPTLMWISGSEITGVYTVNYKLAIPMMMAVTIFEYAWKPFFLREYESEDSHVLFGRILTYFVFVCASIFLLAQSILPFAVTMPFIGGKFINPEYWSGIVIVPIIMIGYLFLGFFTNFTVGVYVAKETKKLPLIVGTAAMVNVIGILILTPQFGIIGAALATPLAYFVSASLLYYVSHKLFPIEYEWNKIFLILLMVFAVWMVMENINIDKFSLFGTLIRLTISMVCIGSLLLTTFYSEVQSIRVNGIKSFLKV